MLQRWLLREPSLALGLPVFVCASMIFPLHLGWTGTPAAEFLVYLAIAAALFSVTDALLRTERYGRWQAVGEQLVLCMAALAAPAALAFAIGAAAGPVDEALDEQVCATHGAVEADTLDAEADDTFDVTADCVADA